MFVRYHFDLFFMPASNENLPPAPTCGKQSKTFMQNGLVVVGEGKAVKGDQVNGSL